MREPACLIRRGTSLDPAMNTASSTADKTVQWTKLLRLFSWPGICGGTARLTDPIPEGTWAPASDIPVDLNRIIKWQAHAPIPRCEPFKQIETIKRLSHSLLKDNLASVKLQLTIIKASCNIFNNTDINYSQSRLWLFQEAAGLSGVSFQYRVLIARDRATPRDAAPPTPPGIRITYHGGSIGLSLDRDIETGETERLEVVVAQGLLDRRVS
ncbi:hypothetical protein [Mesorhizobium sp. M0323]|uniref:hypothetical protein n=1 Tax=Mesorhizobium sp. M0323 TaxID=2956938 RepID=UPI00333A6C12